jgi:hypothetical protein
MTATIPVDSPIGSWGQPLDHSPCLECKLCVPACPVGGDVVESCLDDWRVHVLPNPAAKVHAKPGYPHKHVRLLDSGMAGRTAR